MTITAFLQKFEEGAEAAIPLASVIEFLKDHAEVVTTAHGVDVHLPPGHIAEAMYVILDGHGGVLCISVLRPRVDDSFRNFAFEAMVKFGVCLFEEDLSHIYLASPKTESIPVALRRECPGGVTSIFKAAQIWPMH